MADQSSMPASWMSAAWARVLAAILALVVLGYGLVVPTSLFFLSIGSLECLGPGCDLAVPAAVVGGAVGMLAALATAVVLIVLAIRPARALLIVTLIGLAILPAALLAQGWGFRTLDTGRDVAGEALQLSTTIDRAMQEVLVEVTGSSSLDQPGILGPDDGVLPCDLDNGEPGYQAWSRLTFTPAAGVGNQVRVDIEQAFAASRERMIMIPASIALEQQWQADGVDVRWTVTASCQALPEPSASTE